MIEHDKALEAAARALCAYDRKTRFITLEQRQELIDKNWPALLSRAEEVITAYHAALEGQRESEIAEIIELALNECIGRSKVTPSILTGRGRKEIAGIAASAILPRLAERAAEVERLRARGMQRR